MREWRCFTLPNKQMYNIISTELEFGSCVCLYARFHIFAMQPSSHLFLHLPEIQTKVLSLALDIFKG